MAHPLRTFNPYWRNALFGSLSGTVVFGVIMSALGMMPLIGMLVGVDSAAVGWLVHLALGTIFAVPLAFAFYQFRFLPATAVGLTYGLVLWILGPLILMPAWLGVVADSAMFGMIIRLDVPTPWWSLAGHVIYG